MSFCFALEDSEHILKVGFSGSELPQLLLIYNVLISLWLLKDSFSGYRILSWQFFSFSIVNILAYCLLASKVFDEKYTDYLIGETLVNENFLLACCFQDFLFGSGFWKVLLCLGEALWVHLAWSYLSFLEVYIHVFHQIWEIYNLYFFKYSLCFFLSYFF